MTIQCFQIFTAEEFLEIMRGAEAGQAKDYAIVRAIAEMAEPSLKGGDGPLCVGCAREFAHSGLRPYQFGQIEEVGTGMAIAVAVCKTCMDLPPDIFHDQVLANFREYAGDPTLEKCGCDMRSPGNVELLLRVRGELTPETPPHEGG